MSYLILSNPPHKEGADPDVIARQLGQSIAEAKMKLAYRAPEILSCLEHEEEALLRHEALGDAGFCSSIISQKELADLPPSTVVREFEFLEDRMLWKGVNGQQEVHYETNVYMICSDLDSGGEYKAHRDKEKERKNARQATAESLAAHQTVGLIGQAIEVMSVEFDVVALTQSLTDRAKLELFVTGEDSLKRLHIAPRELRYGGLGEQIGKSSAESFAVLFTMLQEKFLELKIDPRLQEVRYRLPMLAGLEIGKLIPLSIIPAGSNMQAELAARLCYLSSRD